MSCRDAAAIGIEAPMEFALPNAESLASVSLEDVWSKGIETHQSLAYTLRLRDILQCPG